MVIKRLKSLDLSLANIINEDNSADNNYLTTNCFGIKGSASIQKLTLPNAIKGANSLLCGGSSFSGGSLIVDSLFINWEKPYIEARDLGYTAEYHHLFLGDNIDSIPAKAFMFGSTDFLLSVSFSSKMRFIGDGAFYGSPTYTRVLHTVNFESLESLEYLGKQVFKYTSYKPDSLYIPSSITSFDTAEFSYKDGEHIFFHESLTSISCLSPDPFVTSTRTIYNYPFDKKSVVLHFKTMTPPLLPTLNNNTTIVVPKGAKAAYKKVTSVSIIEENPIEKLTVSPKKLSLEIGENSSLTAQPSPLNADDTHTRWWSKDENIVTVSQDGIISAINPGQTFIYVSALANENIKDSCEITVIQHVTGISIEPQSVRLEKIGQTIQLAATISPINATNQGVVWKSFDPNICSITESGYVIAVGYGQTIVTATTMDGNIPASCSILVKKREVPASAIVWEENEFTYTGQAPQPAWRNVQTEYQATAVMPELRKDVGTWQAVVPFTFKDDIDEIVTEVPYTYTINPACIKVKANDATRVYGEENPDFTIQYEGFVNNETIDVLQEIAVANTTAEKNSNVGSYIITVSGAAAQNYTFEYIDATLTIEKAYQTLSWEQDFSDAKQYDQVELLAEASSGLAITYSIEGDNIGSITKIGTKQYLDCSGAGEAVIVAQQEGDKNYWQTTKMYKSIKIVPTAVQNIINHAYPVKTIYDASGRKLSKLQRGLNVVVMKDGTKKKVVVK